VVSSVGRMVEVDLSTLFASFFSIARVKVMRKNLVKIPRERVFEMGDACYVVFSRQRG
jgi:hypothetical protein